MKNDEIRLVPKKNYLILGVIIVISFLLLYYFYLWFDAYKESKINMPIMNKYMEVINYNELDNYLVENPNSIIYVSVLEDETIREFEKKLKLDYKNNKIDKKVLYLDITEELKNKRIDDKYSINSLNITDVPCILIVVNGNVEKIFSVKANNYDVEKVRVFLNNINLNGGE